MIIAAACNKEEICAHFGHSENFNIYETDGERIISAKSVANPGHKPGFLPNFLADMGVNTIIAGGMGSGASEIFTQRKVEIISGARGDSQAAVVAYLKGELKSTGEVCEHDHGQHHLEHIEQGNHCDNCSKHN